MMVLRLLGEKSTDDLFCLNIYTFSYATTSSESQKFPLLGPSHVDKLFYRNLFFTLLTARVCLAARCKLRQISCFCSGAHQASIRATKWDQPYPVFPISPLLNRLIIPSISKLASRVCHLKLEDFFILGFFWEHCTSKTLPNIGSAYGEH